MKIKHILKIFLFRLMCLRKIKKRIVFDSFGGKQYSLDPKAISIRMHELYPDFKQVWIVDKNHFKSIQLPKYIKKVSIKRGILFELPIAFAFVTTDPLEKSIFKRKNQFFVQTWHGDRGFKKCLYEAWENEKRPIDVLDNLYTDVAISGSDFGTDVYRRAFKYYGKVLQVGMPRNDNLIFKSQRENTRFKKELGIDEKTYVLTYAPTFRDSLNEKQPSIVDIDKTLEALNSKGEGKWVCLIRSHSFSSGLKYSPNPNIIDVSTVSDMMDILLITDMLITDYSSCAGDFIVTKKPVILALFDYNDYVSNDRKLRVDIFKTGYKIAKSQNELENLILHTSKEEFEKSSEKVLKFYGTSESGKSSDAICEMINVKYNEYKMR